MPHGIPQPSTPLLQSQGFRVYCAIIALLFGSATLGALAYGAPVMAFMWGFLLVSLIGLPFIVAGLRRQWRSSFTDMIAISASQHTSRSGSADHHRQTSKQTPPANPAPDLNVPYSRRR